MMIFCYYCIITIVDTVTIGNVACVIIILFYYWYIQYCPMQSSLILLVFIVCGIVCVCVSGIDPLLCGIDMLTLYSIVIIVDDIVICYDVFIDRRYYSSTLLFSISIYCCSYCYYWWYVLMTVMTCYCCYCYWPFDIDYYSLLLSIIVLK